MTDSALPSSPDLPLEKQIQASISLALRLNAAGRIEDATAIFEALGRQMSDAGPYAVLIADDKVDGDGGLRELVTLIQKCANELTDAQIGGSDDQAIKAKDQD